MNIRDSLRTAFRGLVANKLRSLLTMLGIMIGVGAVVAMISIGAGSSALVVGQIQQLGSNLLIVMPGSAEAGPGGPRQAEGTMTSLKYEDALAIKREVTSVKAISPEYQSQSQVIYGNQNISTSIQGVTTNYEDVHNFHALYGSFISTQDEKLEARVAVLGQNVVADLFGKDNPIGKTIKVKNVPFRVIGIMEYKGQSGFQNLDDVILIPLSTAQDRLFGVDNLRMIYTQIKSENQMDQASSEISAVLLNRHKIDDPTEADFNIRSQAEILSTVTQIMGTLTILLGGIAAISLLVGGIGIMNIMLVSVTERTREIGLRKALGAKRKDILAQFLIESLILSLFGGSIGIFLGMIGSAVIANIGGWPSLVTLNSILLAFLFSAGIGIFFGVYPARRASLLNPIEALRFE